MEMDQKTLLLSSAKLQDDAPPTPLSVGAEVELTHVDPSQRKKITRSLTPLKKQLSSPNLSNSPSAALNLSHCSLRMAKSRELSPKDKEPPGKTRNARSEASDDHGRLIICENNSSRRAIRKSKVNSKTTNTNASKKGNTQGKKKHNVSEERVQTDIGEASCNEPVVKKRRKARSPIPIDNNDPEFNALGDEIDKVLVEKQMKNNLTPANVKSIIYQVLTNKMVKRMMISRLRKDKLRDQKKAELGADAAEELVEDDYLLFEPTITRSKWKELWPDTNQDDVGGAGTNTESQKSNATKCLWPISPAKLQLKKLETRAKSTQSGEDEATEKDEISVNLLMNSDLPPELDDSEDDEYIPSKLDTSYLSDEDCSSSAASVTSEAGSPAPGCSFMRTPTSTPTRRTRRKDCLNLETSKTIIDTNSNDGFFKTPELPKDKSKTRQIDHAIGLRTRSKLPLNDTPIEHLEDQFIPPDITTDMYDWHQGTESDNEDYLEFLKSYWRPSEFLENSSSKNFEDEEEADPEYNVMEDEDDDHHDKEELRDDRAVKIPKKELTELVAELYETYNDVVVEQFLGVASAGSVQSQQAQANASRSQPNDNIGPEKQSDAAPPAPTTEVTDGEDKDSENISPSTLAQREGANLSERKKASNETLPAEVAVRLTESQNELLRDQIRQHVQLLAQTFILTDFSHRASSTEAKNMIVDVWRRSQLNDASSTFFAVVNIKPAVQFVGKWLENRSKSPIKKKILEERCLNKGYTNGGFPITVAKAIVESEAFCYPELLPQRYFSKEELNTADTHATTGSPKKTTSTFRTLKSEDAILIYELDKIDHRKMKTSEQADFIAQSLPLTKTVYQIYHRLRNLHKSKNTMYQDFVKQGILPTPKFGKVMWDPDEPLAPCNKPRIRLPKMWQRMMHTTEFPRLKATDNKPTSMQMLTSKRPRPPRPSSTTSKRRSQTNVKINIYNEIKDASLPLSYTPPIDQHHRPTGADDALIPASPASQRPRKIDSNIIRRTLPIQSRLNPTLFSVPLLSNPELPSDYTCQTITIYNENGTPALYCSIPNFAFERPGIATAIEEQRTPAKAISEIYGSRDSACVTPKSQGYGTPSQSCQPSSTTEAVKEPVAKIESPEKCGSIEDPKPTEEEFTEIDKTPTRQTAVACLPEPPFAESLRYYKPIFYEGDEEEDDDEEEASRVDLKKKQSEHVDVVDLVSDDELNDTIKSDDDDKESILPTSTSHSPSPSRSESSESSSDDGYISPPHSKFPYRRCGTSNEANDKKESKSSSSSSQPQTSNERTDYTGYAGADAGSHARSTGDGDDEDDKDHSNRTHKDFSSDADDNSQEEVGDEEELASEKDDKKLPDWKKSPHPRKRKTSKSSPTNAASKSAKRSFKYNTAPIEELLETVDSRTVSSTKDQSSISNNGDMVRQGNTRDLIDDLEMSFVESYVMRVRQRVEVESKNPALFNSFINLLTESDEMGMPQKELFVQVESLFKDYPDLVREFAGIIEPEVASEVGRYADHVLEKSYLTFLELLERWTENCPQLKARILQKSRMLREDPSITKEKVIAVIDSLFDQNVVMIEAFKAMFPMLFCPESNPSDFEEIELDMDEKPTISIPEVTSSDHETITSNKSDIDMEVIKLPEEAHPVASSTCRCTCHENATNLQFRNRVKHCNKCRIKYHEGKIYAVSGRSMKPVDVQYAMPAIAKDILQKKVCSNCHKPIPRSKRSRSKSPASSTKAPVSGSYVPTGTSTLNTCTCTASCTSESDTLSNSIAKSSCATTVTKSTPVSHCSTFTTTLKQTSTPVAPPQVKSTPPPNSGPPDWTIEEDRMILTTWHSEGWPTAEAKLGELMANRTSEEISERFAYLQKFIESCGKT